MRTFALLSVLLLCGCAKSPRSLITSTPDAPFRSALMLARLPGDRFTATLELDVPDQVRVLYALETSDGSALRWIEAGGRQVTFTLDRRARPYALLVKSIGSDGSESPIT